jgi:hypothetical protein
VQCSSPVGTVHDLRRTGLAVAGGRPRTNTNETEKETTRGMAPGSTGVEKGLVRCPKPPLDLPHGRPTGATSGPTGYHVPHGRPGWVLSEPGGGGAANCTLRKRVGAGTGLPGYTSWLRTSVTTAAAAG